MTSRCRDLRGLVCHDHRQNTRYVLVNSKGFGFISFSGFWPAGLQYRVIAVKRTVHTCVTLSGLLLTAYNVARLGLDWFANTVHN